MVNKNGGVYLAACNHQACHSRQKAFAKGSLAKASLLKKGVCRMPWKVVRGGRGELKLSNTEAKGSVDVTAVRVDRRKNHR